MEIKAKINKWDLIKLISFCTIKETINKVKRQPSRWNKIIDNQATDIDLISKIYKQLVQLNTRKINGPIKKWAKELNRRFAKEDIQMANKHEKLLNITHYQRNANQNHFTPVRIATIKECTNNKCWRGCREKETLLCCWWECKLVQPI